MSRIMRNFKRRRMLRGLARRLSQRSFSQRAVVSPCHPGLTWTCHVCGKERPDASIDVYQRRHMWPGGVVVTENVRYCNDKPECRVGARDVFWTKVEGDHKRMDAEYVKRP